MPSPPSLERLTDQALLDQFGELVQQDHRRTASLLRHIDAIDHRKLWAKYLSGIHRIKAHLTPEHHMRVLAQAEHKTIRQIEELVAQLASPRCCLDPTGVANAWRDGWCSTAEALARSGTPRA